MTETQLDRFINYAKTLKGSDIYYRESWGCYYFSLLGKSFGMLKPEYLTLKGDPEENNALRDMYSDVIPGYYSNKVHWNSIVLPTDQLSHEEIEKMILKSYTLVYANLSKKNKMVIDTL